MYHLHQSANLHHLLTFHSIVFCSILLCSIPFYCVLFYILLAALWERSALLTGDVLVACASQHGVHGVAHLVEEVLQHPGGEQCGGALTGLGQAQHQHHHRQLVLATLQLTPSTDGEVAVLR